MGGTAVVSPRSRPGGRRCTRLLYRLHGGGNVAVRRTHGLIISPLCLNYLVVGGNSTSNRLTNTHGAANGMLHPTLRVVGASPNVAYISNTVLLLARTPRCKGGNVLIVNSITIAPIPSTRRLTRVTMYATHATRTITNLSPGITVLDFSAGNSTGRRIISGIIRTLGVTGRVTPSVTVSNRLRTSTTLIPRMNTDGTPNSSVTKRTGMLIIPDLRINGVSCGLIRHLKRTSTMKPVLRNVTHPIGSLSHNYSVRSICHVVTVATGRTVTTGGGTRWLLGLVCDVGVLMLGYNDSSVGCGLFSVSQGRIVTRNNVRGVNLGSSFLGFALPDNRGGILRGSVPRRAMNIRFVLGALADPRCKTVGSLSRVGTMNRHVIRKNRGFDRSMQLAPRILTTFATYGSLTPLRGPTGLGKMGTVSTVLPGIPRVNIFSATFRRAVPGRTCLCTIPCRLCRGCNMHHCNFRKASRHCMSRHIYRFLNMRPRKGGVVAYRVNGNNSVATVGSNGYMSADVNLAPLRNLVVNAHDNSVSTNTISFVVRGRNLSTGNVSGLLGGGDNILNVFNRSDSVHSLRGTMTTNGPGTILTRRVCFCHVGGCVNTCTTTLNNISVIMFANNINRGRTDTH